jgi:alanine-synthesizing transaminase
MRISGWRIQANSPPVTIGAMFSHRTDWKLQTNAFTRAIEDARAAGRRLLDLTASNPTTCGFSYPEIHMPPAPLYAPEPMGLLAAREAAAVYYSQLARPVTVDPAQLFLTTSTSEAYSYIFRLLCESGDRVLVPRPSYPLFEFLAQIMDVELRAYSLVYDHGWQIDMHSLEAAAGPRTRAVIVVHPNNPTGSFVKPDEAAALASLCARHSTAIIADEVFLDYSLAAPATSFAANEQCLTFTLSGLSKVAGLPQMKVAWSVVSGPQELRKTSLDRLEVIADTYLSLNTPVQLGMESLLNARTALQDQLKARLRKNLYLLDEKLSAQKVATRLDVEGGWYATLRIPAIHTDEETAISLLRAHDVIVHPGHFFDFESDGYLIISLMTPEADFADGMSRMLEHLSAD